MTETVRAVNSWVERAVLTLADEKTNMILITNYGKKNTVKVEVSEYTVVSKATIKYLGVITDTNLGFREHLEHVCQKTANVTAIQKCI